MNCLSGVGCTQVDDAIHRIAIFSTLQKVMKSNDTDGYIELAREKRDFNSKILNFLWVLPVLNMLQKLLSG